MGQYWAIWEKVWTCWSKGNFYGTAGELIEGEDEDGEDDDGDEEDEAEYVNQQQSKLEKEKEAILNNSSLIKEVSKRLRHLILISMCW